ncbi:MAG TPA: polysaccharide biosynthesis tyrosine autokinase [Tepidisphaeraceae bacterium]|jgi:capsular exopolysaccharide synthesis family protein|nr:polysaccharide biosynthesis tyrosine autokinase [Tepidisphaeraceae bacterium]
MDRYAAPPPPATNGAFAPAVDAGQPGLFQVLWRQRYIVAIPIILLLVVAMIYLATEPNRYQASARLTVAPAGSRLSGDTSDNGQLSNFLYTQGEKMMSREILSLALAQPIPDDSKLPGMEGKTIRDLQTFKYADHPPLTTIKIFADVSVGKKDDALTVTYETPFPDEAPFIDNAIVTAFMKYQTQPKQTNVAQILDVFHADKQKVEAEVNQIAEKMAVLEREYGVLSNNGDDNLAIRQLGVLSQQLAAAHSDTLKAKGDADEARQLITHDSRLIEPGPAPEIGVVSADDEQMLRANLTQMQTRLLEMRAHYLPEHPAVQAMQQKVDQAAATYVEAVRRRYLRAEAAEADFRNQFEQQQKRAMEVSRQAAAYSRLKEDSDRVRRSLETVDNRIHGIELQQSAGAIDIDFFDPADPGSAKRSSPSRTRALGLALVIGLLLGCGVALLRDWTDDRLHSSDQIKASLGIPLLGAIPQMPEGTPRSVSGQKVVHEPNSDVAEAFRSVRTAVQFGAPKDRCKTLLVTSPSAGDGKSTAASNLAAVMAQAGKKVLLVDADLRNPSLNYIFGLKEGRPGLSTLLGGQGTWEQAVQTSAVNGLDLLACGPKSKNPSELLNGPMFSELLEMAAEKYDHVIIDSPPVMGLADARIIAASCDLTLLVLRADKSTRKLATLARDGLNGVGAHVLGVIVNDVSRRSEGHYDDGYRYPSTPREPEAAETRANVLARRT